MSDPLDDSQSQPAAGCSNLSAAIKPVEYPHPFRLRNPRPGIAHREYRRIAIALQPIVHAKTGEVAFMESLVRLLREDGYSPSVKHRNLHARPVDALEWQGNQARPMYND